MLRRIHSGSYSLGGSALEINGLAESSEKTVLMK